MQACQICNQCGTHHQACYSLISGRTLVVHQKSIPYDVFMYCQWAMATSKIVISKLINNQTTNTQEEKEIADNQATKALLGWTLLWTWWDQGMARNHAPGWRGSQGGFQSSFVLLNKEFLSGFLSWNGDSVFFSMGWRLSILIMGWRFSIYINLRVLCTKYLNFHLPEWLEWWMHVSTY